jgi:hypothetical protein
MTLRATDDAKETVRAVIALGVAIRVDDTGRRLLFWPASAVPGSLMADLCSRKNAIIAYLETLSGWVDSWLSSLRNPILIDEWRVHFDECAAVREFEQGNTREVAESIAFHDLDTAVVAWAEAFVARASLSEDSSRNAFPVLESRGNCRVPATRGMHDG